MALFLIESAANAQERSDVDDLIADIGERVRAGGGSLVESRVTGDLTRVFAVVEHDDVSAVASSLDGLAVEDVAPVRLVGAELEEVKRSAAAGPRYLVEWDLPEGLDMETYLARKKAKSPLYDQVPEVAFRRTYVREDMGKCLCFYDGDCEEDVRRARKVVQAPVDRFHELT